MATVRAQETSGVRPGLLGITCEHCRSPFVPKASELRRGRVRYCQRACYLAATIRRTQRTCVTCGTSFLARSHEVERGNVMFCSVACRGSAASFWLHVDKSGPIPQHVPSLGPCWVWMRGKTLKGYGQLDVGGKSVKANRYSFFLEHGRWPEPQCLHHCDNPACVRPSHLFEGTNDDNVADKVRKGRQARLRGEQSPRAKLTESIVRQIRQSYREGQSVRDIVRRSGLTLSCVEDIAYGRSWRHVL